MHWRNSAGDHFERGVSDHPVPLHCFSSGRGGSPTRKVLCFARPAASLLGGSVPYITPHDGPAPGAFLTLTPREVDILPLLTRGYSNKKIARTLGLSEKTIKYHLTHLLKKLGARNRVEAALIASNKVQEPAIVGPASSETPPIS